MGKIKGDLYRSDLAESKCGNQNYLALTTFKGEGFELTNRVFNKKNKI